MILLGVGSRGRFKVRVNIWEENLGKPKVQNQFYFDLGDHQEGNGIHTWVNVNQGCHFHGIFILVVSQEPLNPLSVGFSPTSQKRKISLGKAESLPWRRGGGCAWPRPKAPAPGPAPAAEVGGRKAGGPRPSCVRSRWPDRRARGKEPRPKFRPRDRARRWVPSLRPGPSSAARPWAHSSPKRPREPEVRSRGGIPTHLSADDPRRRWAPHACAPVLPTELCTLASNPCLLSNPSASGRLQVAGLGPLAGVRGAFQMREALESLGDAGGFGWTPGPYSRLWRFLKFPLGQILLERVSWATIQWLAT